MYDEEKRKSRRRPNRLYEGRGGARNGKGVFGRGVRGGAGSAATECGAKGHHRIEWEPSEHKKLARELILKKDHNDIGMA